MSLEEKDVVKFFREQAAFEEEIIESVNEALMNIKNAVVKSILKGMALDSSKHASIYRAAEQIIKVAPALTENELEELKKVLRWHIDSEEKVIKRLQQALKKTQDKKIRLLLKAIAADERRHHKLLDAIMNIVVKGETIADDEWWEMLWKNVPFHGSPGG